MGITRPGRYERSAATVACIRPAQDTASRHGAIDWGGAYPSSDAEGEEVIVFSDAATDELFSLQWI